MSSSSVSSASANTLSLTRLASLDGMVMRTRMRTRCTGSTLPGWLSWRMRSSACALAVFSALVEKPSSVMAFSTMPTVCLRCVAGSTVISVTRVAISRERDASCAPRSRLLTWSSPLRRI